MERFRQKIGVTPPPETPKKPPTTTEPDSNKLLRTQNLLLKQKQEEFAEVSGELEVAIKGGKQAAAKFLLQKKHALEKDIRLLEGKIANSLAVKNTLADADSNLQQAALLKAGADQLQELTAQTEALEVADVVDSFKQGASLTYEQSAMLSEPLYGLHGTGDEVDIDEELEEMMAASRLSSLPAVGGEKIVPGK